jgi:DNA-binding PadR family transcriptional regulator
MTTQNDPEHASLSQSEFHILLALVDGEKHGYAIMKEVAEQSEGRTRLGPGTLYGAIKRMVQTGLIVASDERPDPERHEERRRYYQITTTGRRLAEAEARRLAELVRVALDKQLVRGSVVLKPARG